MPARQIFPPNRVLVGVYFSDEHFPAFSFASFSNAGAIILQGPHQGAQKSTMTGTLDCKTVFSKARLYMNRLIYHLFPQKPLIVI